MASSETGTAEKDPRDGVPPRPAARVRTAGERDLSGLEAGLDALDTVVVKRVPVGQILLKKVLPPVTAVVLVLVVWQLAVWGKLADPTKLPSPHAVGQELADRWNAGDLLSIIWTSVERGLLGFLAALAIGTPLGLVVARVPFVRAAIGPILSGLQSLPSVAWVPAAVIWLGIEDSAMYAVILLGAVPSIANGLVAGIDQVPPLYLRAGRTIGATGLRGAWHILLPAALPGYVAGLKQGWAFSWRSLMAAELIASSPDLGVGLGRYLENMREGSDMAGVFLGILLILLVGIAIDQIFFSPLERWVLRSRGLSASSQ
jgi:NitT/TauT family transport system permease protein